MLYIFSMNICGFFSHHERECYTIIKETVKFTRKKSNYNLLQNLSISKIFCAVLSESTIISRDFIERCRKMEYHREMECDTFFSNCLNIFGLN